MSEENIFSEVDEELRSERMRNLWKRFAPWVFGAVALIILGVAGKEAWTWYKKDISSTSSDLYYSAIELADENNFADAQAALNKVVNEGSGQYSILAQFRSAALLLENGKVDEAVAAYDALSTSISNQRLRELALIFAAFALVDSGDVKAVEARVSGLLGSEAPMRNRAKEAIGLTKYAAGDIDGAREVFTQIVADPFVDRESVGRVQIYIAQLVSQGAKEPLEVANKTEAEQAQSQ